MAETEPKWIPISEAIEKLAAGYCDHVRVEALATICDVLIQGHLKAFRSTNRIKRPLEPSHWTHEKGAQHERALAHPLCIAEVEKQKDALFLDHARFYETYPKARNATFKPPEGNTRPDSDIFDEDHERLSAAEAAFVDCKEWFQSFRGRSKGAKTKEQYLDEAQRKFPDLPFKLAKKAWREAAPKDWKKRGRPRGSKKTTASGSRIENAPQQAQLGRQRSRQNRKPRRT